MRKQFLLLLFACMLLFTANAQTMDSAAMAKSQQRIESNLKDANKHQRKIDRSQRRIKKQENRINRQERRRERKLKKAANEEKKINNG